jgi:hypothetical protein
MHFLRTSTHLIVLTILVINFSVPPEGKRKYIIPDVDDISPPQYSRYEYTSYPASSFKLCTSMGSQKRVHIFIQNIYSRVHGGTKIKYAS